MRDIISRHRSIPYQNRFIFTIDDSSDKKVQRHQQKEVIVKNYLTDEVVIYPSYIDAGVKTGVKSSTLRLNAINGSDRLISGHVFRLISKASEPWPEFSSDVISASVLKNKRVQ